MRIGIFTDTYHPDINGVVTSIKMLEQEMTRRGHEVFIFSPTKHEPTENQNLYMLKSIPLFVAKKYNYRIASFYSRSIAKQIKELNLDVVHTQSEFSLGQFAKIISRKFNIPFVHTYHTMWEDYVHYVVPIKGGRNIYPRRFCRNFSKNFVRKADAIISPSKKTEKYLKYRCKVKNKDIFIVPTGIDLKPFRKENFTAEQKESLKKELGLSNDDKIILFVGRIAKEKSVDVLLKGMPEILKKEPNAKFVIVGDGPSVDELKELAKTLKIEDKIIFTGRQPWEKIAIFYSIGDVFVNASTTETQGLTFIEAMGAEIPVIAKYDTNLDGIITNNETGLFFTFDKDYSKTVLKLLGNDKLKEKLRKNGLVKAEKYEVKYFGESLEKVYTFAIDHHKNVYETRHKKLTLRKQSKDEE